MHELNDRFSVLATRGVNELAMLSRALSNRLVSETRQLQARDDIREAAYADLKS